MRKSIGLVLVTLLLVFGGTGAAQESIKSPEVTVMDLKQQLSDIEYKQLQLRMRLAELEQELKPVNIERALAGIGSTRPEELREQRRKLLTMERDVLQTELGRLEDKRLQTESAIVDAEAAAYWKSAEALPSPSPLPQPLDPSLQLILAPDAKVAHVLFQITLVAVIFILFCAAVLSISIKLYRRS